MRILRKYFTFILGVPRQYFASVLGRSRWCHQLWMKHFSLQQFKQGVWLWTFSDYRSCHHALLVNPGHLSMFSMGSAFVRMWSLPGVVIWTLRGLPKTLQALRSAILFTSLVSCLLVVLINWWHFWLQVLGFAFCCFTSGSSKPWKPPMLHFFLWSLHHATGFVSAWIAGNVYLPLRKYPKSMNINKTKASRSQWCNPVWDLAVQLQGYGAGCGRMRSAH